MVLKKLPKMPKSKAPAKGKEKKEDPKPAPAPAGPAKAHERKAKKSEEDAIARGRRLAISYLEQRDGMDEDTAKAVVESMSPEDINELIHEANVGTAEKLADKDKKEVAEAKVPDSPKGNLVPEEDKAPTPDFTDVPALLNHETFAQLATELAELQAQRSMVDKKFEAKKAEVRAIMADNKVQKVGVAGAVFTRYQTSSSSIVKEYLLEKGVSIDTINACTRKVVSDAFKVTLPKGA